MTDPPEESTLERASADATPQDASEDDVTLEKISPDVAFGLLASDVRIAILRALWEAPESTLSFAALRRQTAAETNNFDYHLRQLLGHFVRQTEDGYSLRYAGTAVMRAVIGGVLTENPQLSPQEIDARCPYCGSTVELRYDDEILTARCTDCGGVIEDEEYPRGTYMRYAFPPAGLVERGPDDVLDAAHVFYDSKLTPMMNDVCPECAATTTRSFDVCDNHAPDNNGLCDTCKTRFEVWTEYVCDRCQYSRTAPIWFEILNLPVVIAFLHQHGNLARSVPLKKLTWDSSPSIRSIRGTRIEKEPNRFRVTVPVDETVLTLELDDSLDLLESTVRSRGSR